MSEKSEFKAVEQKSAVIEPADAGPECREVSQQESQRRYRTLLDFAPYPVATFTLNGRITYVNPAFTDVFGWSLDEMRSGKALFVPPGLAPETSEMLKELFKERVVTRYVTQRLSKDGRVLDVIARGAVFSKKEMGVQGELVIFRDITRERRVSRNNEAMLRISMALPEYTDLEALLDYISSEIKALLNTQGALVILLDEQTDEFFFPGAAYDDDATRERVKEIRLPVDSMVSGKVVKTGRPVMDNDASKDSGLYLRRDREFGYSFDNYVIVPVHSSGRIIGVLAAFNKREGLFETLDMELLEMIAGTVGLSIENARFSDELKKSHRELLSLDRAKSKAINHLSHELKTPVAIFSGTLTILEKKLARLPQKGWKRSVERAQRNLDRVRRLQDEITDIILEKESDARKVMGFLVEQCADLLEDTVEMQSGTPGTADRVRERINDIFAVKQNRPETVMLGDLSEQMLSGMKPRFAHRPLLLEENIQKVPPVFMPKEMLQKVVRGLVKNAVENTPDHGRIIVSVDTADDGRVRFCVQDSGIGIIEDHQKRIFEGFFTTQETADYSTGSSFNFNAGGRGADLLRMKIFSERYGFGLHASSKRCVYIPRKEDMCPGDIDNCPYCRDVNDCFESGGSIFSAVFTPAEDR